MNAYPRILAFAVLAIAAGQGIAADVGRVVLAAGDATALREGKVMRLNFGSPVQDQDTLRTGAESNLQVRFEDDSYVSLRPGSELKVREFRYSGKEDGSERAIFSLIKGGLRAITGLIGRRSHENYRMDTATSTIGIRGTDYASTLCQGDCRNPDGSLAKDGLYGRVIGQSQGTNQIEVSNDVDRKVFGINSNFFVGDRKSPIEALLVAPDFVLSKLEGRRRGGSKGSAGGTGSEQATSGGVAEESRPSTTPPPLQPLQFVATQELSPQGAPAVLPPANGWVVVYPLPFNAPLGDVVFDDETPGVFNGLNQLIAYGTPGVYPAGSLGGGSITDSGSLTASNGQVFSWGRWTGPTTVVLSEGTTFTGAPVLFGTASGVRTDSPSVVGLLGGVATYTYWGGPKPVDAGGNVGSISSTSTTINFTMQTQQLSLAMDFPSVLVSGVNTGSAVFNLSGQGFASPETSTGELIGALSGTCTGGGCYTTSPGGFFSTGLTGPNDYGIAVTGGVVVGTQAGDVGFLNAYQLSSFTPGPLPTNTTAQIAFANLSPSVPGSTWTLSTSEGTYSGNNLVAFTTSSPLYGNLAGGAIVETGSTALVDGGTMSWGRWTGATQVNDPVQGLVSPSTGLFFVAGQSATLPTSGTFLYTFAGGPNPTNVNGVSGTFTGGAFNVSFGSTSGSLAVASPLTLSVGGVGYSLGSCTSGCSFTNTSPVAGNMQLSGTCVGGACSTSGAATGSAAGVFVGPQGAGLAVAGNIFSPEPTVTFGAAFKR